MRQRPAVDVYVIQVEGHYYVRPGTFVVPESKERVTFRNITQYTVTLVFDDGKKKVSIRPGAQRSVEVNRGRETTAVAYKALLSEIGIAAMGQSSPILIIER